MNKNIKTWFIIAGSLMLLGCILFIGVMTMLNWNFEKLSTDKFVTNEYKISENFKNISVKSINADIILIPSTQNETKVICNEYKKIPHSVTVENNTLIISPQTKKWYNHLGIHFKTPKITIQLPKDTYASLTINATTGNVTLPKDFTFNSANISVTTGNVFMESSVLNNINCKTTTGDIDLNQINCNSLTISGTTSDVKMKNVVAKDKVDIHLTTGDVIFESCDGAELLIRVTTGDVIGTLLSNKTFDAKSTTGKVTVPKSKNGGLCKVKATTGSIKIDLVP